MPAELNQVVGEVIDLMRARAQDKHVELVWQPAAEFPTLTFDPDGIHRAILNVASNAIDACAEAADSDDESTDEPVRQHHGRVVVSTCYDATVNLARIAIKDNGVGIPAEELQNIFSLFVSHKGSRGTGLGLPVSEKIMKEHGGRITVDSEVGRGSCFTLELPAVLPDAVRPTTALEFPPRE